MEIHYLSLTRTFDHCNQILLNVLKIKKTKKKGKNLFCWHVFGILSCTGILLLCQRLTAVTGLQFRNTELSYTSANLNPTFRAAHKSRIRNSCNFRQLVSSFFCILFSSLEFFCYEIKNNFCFAD